MQGLVNLNKTILPARLYNRTQITLDIDTTVIELSKRAARYTYKTASRLRADGRYDAKIISPWDELCFQFD